MTMPPRFPMAHTFSIVARDSRTGEMGVAVQSHWFSVGSIVAWGRAGVGVVATQAMVEISYGPRGLALMSEGVSAPIALQALLQMDENREVRQVAVLDAQNRVAVHTGARCIAEAGHHQGEGYSVQANMMKNSSVWPAMAEAYETTHGDLAERLLAALEAAQAVGGDIRGQQSACLLIVKGERSERPWEGVVMDLRVEDHLNPIGELRRLVHIHRAYQQMNAGDAYLAEGKIEEALAAYRQAAQMVPEIDELPFWHAVTLAELGRLEEALPIFRRVFASNPDWATLLARLPRAGLLRQDEAMLNAILAQQGPFEREA